MSSVSPQSTPILQFVVGDDDFEVTNRCRQILAGWQKDNPTHEPEIVDGQAKNEREVAERVAALRNALENPSLFTSGKLIWFRQCDFLGEGTTAQSRQTSLMLDRLVESLERLDWQQNHLLISAPGIKWNRKIGRWLKLKSEITECPSLAKVRNADRIALSLVREQIKSRGKTVKADVAEQLVRTAGLDRRVLVSECEKVVLYVGDRKEITGADLEASVYPTRQAKAFALVNAVSERNLPLALDRLEDELWTMRTEKQTNELGVIYSLITKFRNMLLFKELQTRQLLRANLTYPSFKSQLANLKPEQFPADRRFNPLAQSPFFVFQAYTHSRNYSKNRLIQILELLLATIRKMITVSVDPPSVLRECIIGIVQGEEIAPGSSPSGEP